jgi:hypothetical protein
MKLQPSANDPRVVGGAGIQMHEDAAEQYLAYKLIDSNLDWKSKWFYITNHHPELPKPSGKQPKHRPGGIRSRRCKRVSSYPNCW